MVKLGELPAKGHELKTGVVIIGRNEGERLRLCLRSALDASKVIYVDSGSTDNSIQIAKNMGAEVVCLDMNLPFTAARARNAGFRRIHEISPNTPYVQFVDGDCELATEWLSKSVDFMDANLEVAMACGRLRERFPEQSIYNLLCDIEWNTPVGNTKACGGIALVRSNAFESMRGFQESMIAGEEPELCVRLRAHGWKIRRLDEEMALHDAAMTRFSQWWRRAMRCGYAFAEGAYLHGSSPERHWVKESYRAWFWGLLLPIIGLLLTGFSWGYGLMVIMIYLLQIFRLAIRHTRQKIPRPWTIASFIVLGKFPEMLGQMKFQYNRLIGKPSKLIEYK
jgi:glycosyltransferase involved in cell wall biosynthesis